MNNSTEKNSVVKHGAHTAIKEYREGKAIDPRTKLGRYLKKTREDFIEDLGGTLSPAQEIILNRILEQLMFLSIIGEHAKGQGTDIVRDGKIIRPLIKLSRSEIIDFLNLNGLKYVSDASNRDMRYLRNRVRHKLIPLLKTVYNPKISETLNRLSSIMHSEEAWIEEIIHPLFEKSVLDVQDDRIAFSISTLDRLHTAAQRRILRKAIFIHLIIFLYLLL